MKVKQSPELEKLLAEDRKRVEAWHRYLTSPDRAKMPLPEPILLLGFPKFHSNN